jgi:hypothetical protein
MVQMPSAVVQHRGDHAVSALPRCGVRISAIWAFGSLCRCPVGFGILHVYARGPALGEDGIAPTGSGAIQHVSLTPVGYHAFVERFQEVGLPWREFLVSGTTLWQLLVYDPSGVELAASFTPGAFFYGSV